MDSLFAKFSKPKKTKTDSQAEVYTSIPHQLTDNGPFGSFFALIIGIDNYAAPNELTGAVADACAMKRYLKEKLGVPEVNITTLLNEQASRENIIRGIRALTKHRSISRKNPILIYFAGHGSERPAPKSWHSEDPMVQLIIPQDCYTEKNGKRVRGIPDRTINALLEELATEKGDNIVVILDCCHSGSGTRARRVRCMRMDEDIPDDLDTEIWDPALIGRAIVPKGFKYHGDASHVLLAACASNQSAMEENDQGLFTTALLNTLTTHGFEKQTYISIIKLLPELPGQHPRCEGKNRGRFWFTTKFSRDGPYYNVKKEADDYVIEAGSVHGIAEGSEFILYKKEKDDTVSTFLGKAKAITVSSMTSIVKLGDGISEEMLPVAGAQISFGEAKALRIYLGQDPKLDSLRNKVQHEIKSNPNIYILAKPEESQLHILAHEDTATFVLANSLVQTMGLRRIPFRVKLQEEDAIIGIIEATCRFIWYLSNHPVDLDIEDHHTEKPYQEPASIFFTKLEERRRNEWFPLVPLDGSGDLNVNNQVDIIDGKTKYGLKITNNTSENLYPYLFLFNCNDLSIDPYYIPPTVKNTDRDPPLSKEVGSITVGYGSGGGRPWRHVVESAKGTPEDKIVRDEEDLQVEFFKLILTTKPVDLSFIEQASPFDKLINRVEKVSQELSDTWETVLLAVVVRKDAKNN